jgi:hypothetical protein
MMDSVHTLGWGCCLSFIGGVVAVEIGSLLICRFAHMSRRSRRLKVLTFCETVLVRNSRKGGLPNAQLASQSAL